MDALHAALEKLARNDGDTLSSYFHEIESHSLIEDTSATCHFHCINLDGSGRPKVDTMIEYLMVNIIDYAIPRSKINAALKHQQVSGTTVKYGKLFLQSLSLFSRLANSGEGGELILFLFAERFLKLPQIICKMSLKTSSQMHFHGADGVYMGVDRETQKLCLYWGESKLYSNATSSIYECMKSVAPLVSGNMGSESAESRDMQLLTDFMNLDDPELEDALKKFLDPDDPAFNQLEYRGICLVGFDSENYPKDAHSQTLDNLVKNIRLKFGQWQSRLKDRLSEEKLNRFSMHVFILPFPSVEDFRKKLLRSFSGDSE